MQYVYKVRYTVDGVETEGLYVKGNMKAAINDVEIEFPTAVIKLILLIGEKK